MKKLLNPCCKYINVVDLSPGESKHLDSLVLDQDRWDLEGTEAEGTLVYRCSTTGHAYVHALGSNEVWDLTGRKYGFVITRTVQATVAVIAGNMNEASNQVWDLLRKIPGYNMSEYQIRIDRDLTDFPYE